MKVAVYRTIFGNYENIKPILNQSIDFDYYCITDNVELTLPGCKTIVPLYPRQDLHPRLRAKYFKLFPYEIPELNNYDVTIYIDGSINITDSDFIAWCLRNLKGDMLLFKHPQRNCIYDEFNASKELNKYKNEMQDCQLTFYSSFHPRKAGLYACGVLVRRDSDILRKVMHCWWDEIIKYSWQDQVSLPVVCKLLNFKPDTFIENQYKNKYFQVLWHDDAINNNQKQSSKYKISVLMPVKNTVVEYLQLAIDSILTQTYTDFEFIIVDDNSDDENTLRMLGNYAALDARIRLIKKNISTGIAAALNTGLEYCHGDIIIRMDSDDIANKLLIEKQVNFFNNNKDAVVCGVQINIFGNNVIGSPVTSHSSIVTKDIARRNTGFWIINHPGVAFKKDVILKMGGYGDIDKNKAEDYALWCKLLHNGYVLNNMKDVLIYYRKIEKKERLSPEWKDFLIKCRDSI